MKYARWIWRFWQPHRQWLFLLAFLTLLSSAVTLAYPMVLGRLIDDLKSALASGDPHLAWVTTRQKVLLLLGIGLARALANLYPGARAMLNSKLEMDIRQYYFSQILTKSHRFFQRFRTGDLVTRLTDDIGGFPKIAWFCCSGIFRAVESASKFIFSITYMLLINWQLALISMIPLPVMLLLFYYIRRQLRERALQRQAAISRTNDMLEAAFSGIRILKAFNGEPGQARSFSDLLDERIVIELRLTKLWMGMGNLYDGIQKTGHILVIVAGGLMAIKGQLSIGEFYAFYVYQSLLLFPLLDIPNLFVTSRQAFACIDREIEIEEADAQPAQGGSALPQAASGVEPQQGLNISSIELSSASFSYEEGLPDALHVVTLRLRAGQKAAIVGSVGSGKTTLIKLAAGILQPSSGEVLVNGRPLAELDREHWRSRVGYIPQEANLFSESVMDNVRFGRELDEEQVRAALRMAQVLPEMEALPAGLAQVLGQRGLTVSGGQKQRLAIARALAGSPDLLLMDDVTSALDAENERRFWDMLAEALPEAACLIVTHRLSTARQADVIHMLVDGRIAGSGTHAELMASCEPYRRFLAHEELAEELQEVAAT